MCDYFKKHKDIFGKPGEGVHSVRLMNLAIADVIMTVVIGIVLAYYFSWNYVATTCLLFLIGIFMHRLFGVRTTIDKLLFDIPDRN